MKHPQIPCDHLNVGENYFHNLSKWQKHNSIRAVTHMLKVLHAHTHTQMANKPETNELLPFQSRNWEARGRGGKELSIEIWRMIITSLGLQTWPVCLIKANMLMMLHITCPFGFSLHTHTVCRQINTCTWSALSCIFTSHL